jgi:NADPH-dependent 2,4-dienoyl-CoA reductase/sulfur reductase-like enzyme
MSHLLIIGGSDAGIGAALRAREISPSTEITVLVADRYPNFSICGLPFLISGEVMDWKTLAHRTTAQIEKEDIRVLLDHRATEIDPQRKTVAVFERSGRSHVLDYDKLVVATGAVSVRPSIQGLAIPGVFFLRWMEDGFSFQDYLVKRQPASALIVGSGYIGMEMADALARRGLSVTVLVRSALLKTLDSGLGQLIWEELTRNGVEVVNTLSPIAIERSRSGLTLRTREGVPLQTDAVLVATGARPESELARRGGVLTGIRDAIRVNRAMETNVPDIYAAGDCVETWHRLLQEYTYLPLGTTAHKQGRVAGENAVGGHVTFGGSLGTQVVKIFDLVAARTGLLDTEASEAGFDPMTFESECDDHKAYYPGATRLRIRITADLQTKRLLGAQIVGHHGAEVAKRIDIFAAAIFNNMTVEDINHLDLSYTPPLGSPWDAIQMAAQAWVRERQKGLRPTSDG